MSKTKRKSSRRRIWRRRWRKFKFQLMMLSLLALLMFGYLWPMMLISIKAGHGGVLWQRFEGGTSNEPHGEGMAIIAPWDVMHIYDLRIQELTLDAKIYTNRGLEMDVVASTRFRVQKRHIAHLHKELGPDYVEKVVRPEVVSSLRSVLGNYTAEQIYAKEEINLNAEIRDVYRRKLLQHDLEYVQLVLIRLRLPPEIQTAIQHKLREEQRVETYEHRVEREWLEADRKRIEGIGIREFELASEIDVLKWRGVEATQELAKSANAKVVVIGSDGKSLPVILNAESSTAQTLESADGSN